MIKTYIKETGINALDIFGKDVLVAFSGRLFGHSGRLNFLKEVNIVEENLVLGRQVHGTDFSIVTRSNRLGEMPACDGLFTRQEGIALGILTADCLPIFLWDPSQRAAGIIHAGWRGLASKIAAKAVTVMNREFQTEGGHLQVAFGPAIRECCYEVGDEFREIFPKFFKDVYRSDQNKGHMDLAGEAADQLSSQGVLPENIFDTGHCTYCENGRFFSARRERNEERMLSVIQIKCHSPA